MARYSSVLELIGSTPVVDVSALSPNPRVTILAKLEGRNPAGSVKDRVALSLVDAAEADGRFGRVRDLDADERLARYRRFDAHRMGREREL